METDTGSPEQIPSTPTTEKEKPTVLNGIDTAGLFRTIDALKADPAKASCKFFATTHWRSGAVSDTKIDHYEISGQDVPLDFHLAVDEPKELLGSNLAPNPQMILYAALNTCVLNTFVINAAARGLRVDSVEIDTRGELDLRGFLGIDENVNPGYDTLSFVFRVTGEGTEEQFRQCLEAGTRYSPNFQTITRAVKVHYELEIG